MRLTASAILSRYQFGAVYYDLFFTPEVKMVNLGGNEGGPGGGSGLINGK